MVTRKEHGEMEFRFFRPGAQEVYLVGEFNGWHPSVLPMVRQEDGNWVYQLQLPEGVYQFRYLADGHWYNDYAGFGLEHSAIACNSVVWFTDPNVPVLPAG